MSGCLTLEQMAPPVDHEFQAIALRRGVDSATLELGRRVYLSDCARCHGVEPVARYSVEQWGEILPRMAQESKLDAEHREALEAYVMAARMILEERARRESAGVREGETTLGRGISRR